MRNRVPLLIAGAALLFISSVSFVPSNFGSTPQSTKIQVILDDLRGLSFDEFVDASYKQILLRSPELVTSMGLSETLGLRDDQLDNVCYADLEETYALKDGIREILKSHNRSELDYDQAISYDSYAWLLADWAAERQYMYHFYPVTHGFSRQNELFRFFEDEQPLETRNNVNSYIRRLTQFDDQFACLIGNLQDSEARGITAPAQILQRAADKIRGIVPGTAASLSFYTTLETKIGAIAGLGVLQRRELLAQAIQAINTSVIPAYQALVAALDQQVPRAPPMNGVWQLPDGDAFYTAMLRHHTTTALSAEEIHQQGLDEVARIRGEIRAAFDLLGYPANESFAQIYERVGVDSGVVPAAQIVALNEDFIRQAQADITEVFDIAPQTEVIVIGSAGGGYYVAGSLDGSRPGAFYLSNHVDDYRYSMRTIAYHETVPGHHFQIAIGNEQDVPLFSKGGGFYTAFVEGWALYAEYLVMELGWYDDDIYSELGRMQWELLRAARMVLDTGLHHYRWSRKQAIDYYIDAVGITPELATQQIDLYLYWPGYFTAYKTGMLKILEYRQHAMDELGELFDIKAFHRAVLLHNRLPLPLLERVVEDYIVSIAPSDDKALGLGSLCLSMPNTPPTPLHIADTGSPLVITMTMNTTVLAEMEDGQRKLRHQAIMTAKDGAGALVWRRTFLLKSKGIATVIPGVPGYQFGKFFQNTNTVSPVLLFNSECMGLGVAESAGQKYVMFALGTQAANGTPAIGEDDSLVNIWVLNKNTGQDVRVFRPRAQISRYFLPFTSGVYDIDNDSSDELVLIFAKFVGTERYDFVIEVYNLKTGVRKNTIRTNQFNRFRKE